MRRASTIIATSLLLAGSLPGASEAQSGGFVPGSRDLFVLDLASVPVGEFPKQLTLRRGNITVVEKDGMHMLRASGPRNSPAAEFLVPLPEVMPQNFTLEFDVVPKLSGNPWDLSFEGTQAINQGEASMRVMWMPTYTMTVGGGAGTNDKMPAELAASIPAVLTEVRASFEGTTFKLFTNGTPVLSLNRKFVRSRVLRVELGGQDDKDYAVYLARLRIAAGGAGGAVASQGAAVTPPSAQPSVSPPSSPAVVTGVVVRIDAQGIPTVTWNQLQGATGYYVVRWKSDDPNCCNNLSPPGQPLASTRWLDASLPRAGSYYWRVMAITSAGIMTGEAGATYSAAGGAGSLATGTPPPQPAPLSPPPTSPMNRPGGIPVVSPPPPPPPAPISVVTATPTTTGTITPMASASGSTTTSSSGSGLPANTMNPASSSGLPANAGRYRVTLTGLRAAHVTEDDILDADGKKDEVYGMAAAVHWKRDNASVILDRSVVRTREYGDIGTANRWPARIKAGTVSQYGGIWAGIPGRNQPDQVPMEFDPSGNSIPAPAGNQFPLLVWEGVLQDGVDAVLIVPSIWERDGNESSSLNYRGSWTTSPPAGMLESQSVEQQYANPGLTPVLAPEQPAMVVALTASAMFRGLLLGNWAMPLPALSTGVDRPIGMAAAGLVVTFRETFVLVTREKLAGLPVGGATTIAIPFAEPPNMLGGMYTLYLRAERIQ